MNTKIKDIKMINPDHTIQEANIFVVGDKIAHIGINAPKDFHADYLIDGRDKIAVPGFINAHTHGYMSIFRNWLDDLTHEDWYTKLEELEQDLTSDEMYPACLLSISEMLQTGTTCFVDMHNYPDSTITAATDVNMTAIVSRRLQDTDGQGDKYIEEAIEEYEKYRENPYFKFLLAPYSVEKCDDKYLDKIAKVAKKYKLGIHTHLSASELESARCISRYHMSPAKLLEECELLSPTTIVSSCANINDEDIDILAHHHVNVALTTSSDLKFGNRIAPMMKLKDAGLNLCIGTDSPSGNNSVNMLEEMKFTSLVQKSIERDPAVATAHEMFDMVTVNGAKAVGMEKSIGKLERGYNADIVIYDLNDLPLIPFYDPISAICYSPSNLTAHTVICNGKIIIYEKDFIELDIFKLRDQVTQTVTDKILKIVG